MTIPPEFTGGDATVTLGINGQPISDYSGMFGDITSTPGQIPIPVAG